MSDWQARLAELMDSRQLSGSELARRAGFTSQYVNSLRSGERGGRLPHATAKRLAAALGVSVEWLVQDTGPRERLSDKYPAYLPGDAPGSGYTDRYPSRLEAIALLASSAAPEVIRALLAVVPADPERDPGRAFWIDYAKKLAVDLRKIQNDPAFDHEASAAPNRPPPRAASEKRRTRG